MILRKLTTRWASNMRSPITCGGSSSGGNLCHTTGEKSNPTPMQLTLGLWPARVLTDLRYTGARGLTEQGGQET
ncbi:MAG: hypothetical protein ACKOAU_06485 [Pirellula sp.]